VPDRLSALDASFLYLEEPTAVMHVGSVAVFEPPDHGFDYERLVALVSGRIAYVPRYRQRVRTVPGRLANPVWVDDENFDVAYHVRRSALPGPGTEQQLADLVARLQSRALDRTRPLWELYLVEGLTGGRFAVVTKAHQAMVDGVNAVDIAQVILEDSAEVTEVPTDTWRPAAEPTDVELVVGAVTDAVRSPGGALDTLRGSADDVRATAGRAAGQLGSLLSVAARSATRPAPTSPLSVVIGEQRRYVMVSTSLADHRAVRSRHARPGQGGLTINDVVLATVAGALRAWLLNREESVRPATVVRALVPVSVEAPETGPAAEAADGPGPAGVPGTASSGQSVSRRVGSQVAAFVVDLPVGEPNPAIRLHQVAYAMRAQTEAGEAVRAQALVGMAGFAPPTLHSIGARVASAASRRLANLTVTNVPGPQHPMYAAGARMLASYPVMPLTKGRAVSIGLTSYDGGVFYGVNGDLNAMADIDVLGQCLIEALAELREGRR
jgi:diacylglycerol O-acyltransferase / wax synthase